MREGGRTVEGGGGAAARLRVGFLVLLGSVLLAAAGCGAVTKGTVGAEATTATTNVVLPIANEVCLRCHTDFAKVTSGENRKEFSHDLHLRQRITCSTCHVSVGHGGAPQPDRKLCAQCHGLSMPHPPDYRTAHGRQVVANGGEVCKRCHNVYLHCQECHGVQMPHPAQWTEKHGQVAYPRLQVCSRCHQKTFCLRCHPVEMPHPADWTRSHGAAAAAKGSAVCARCHAPEQCAACHGTPMPHPKDWGTRHQEEARAKRAACMLCHVEKDCSTCHDIHRTHGKGGGS